MLYQGSGVGGAKVLIDGKQQTTTGPDGMYHLENMKTGTYRIQVQKEHMSFDEITVKITPNTPQIQDIIASGCVITGILLDIENIVCKGREITFQIRFFKNFWMILSILKFSDGVYFKFINFLYVPIKKSDIILHTTQ